MRQGGTGLGGAIDVGEELCENVESGERERGREVDVHLEGCV